MTPMSLTQLVRDHLDAARLASSGRSSVTIAGGREHRLRQNLMALTQGQALGKHESPGEATIQVLHGLVRLSAESGTWDLAVGDYLPIPPERHDLAALTDAVVLLTVVKAEHHDPASPSAS